MEKFNQQIESSEIQPETLRQEIKEKEDTKDPTGDFLREQGFNGNPKIKYSIDIITAKTDKGINLVEEKNFDNYKDLQNFIKNNSDIIVGKKLMEETGIVPFKIDYDQSVYDWSSNLSKEQSQKLMEEFDKFSNEAMDVKNFIKVGENKNETEKKINQIKSQILSGYNNNSELSQAIENQTTEKGFRIEIPKGWTTLKHGTNLLNWGEINPYTSDMIKLEKPLSVITQEDFEQDQRAGKQYDTTKNYATIIQKPEGMTDTDFEQRNKQFEIRVLFYQDHIRHNTDSGYKQKLDKRTLDEIAKYYFLNMQNGRHPLVPKGEILKKIGQTQENGKDVFYFVPESVSNTYKKETSEDEIEKENKNDSLTQALFKKELIEALNIPSKEYTQQKGVAAISEVFRKLYTDKNQLVNRLEEIIKEFKSTLDISEKDNPQKAKEAHYAFSNKKTLEKLTTQERTLIEDFLNKNYKKMGGEGQRMISTEYVFSHFINFIKKIDNTEKNFINKEINPQNVISKEDFKKFVEKNEVSVNILQNIAKKIINGEQMSQEEISIYSHKSNDIEKMIQNKI